jgi:uncharacterized protein YcaQ
VSPLEVPSLQQLRRYAIARSLFKPTSLPRAIARLGFVQADPMRAPARAQDLILAYRVKGYRAGELERRFPVVWDRRRFHLFWGWEYKMEAYVPAHKRRMGHYAMPILWGEQIPGWANLKVVDGRLQHELGFAGPRPRGRAFQLALDDALQHMHEFLQL